MLTSSTSSAAAAAPRWQKQNHVPCVHPIELVVWRSCSVLLRVKDTGNRNTSKSGIMRGIGALGCALVAVHGATGFVAPLSARAPGRQAPRAWYSTRPAATRLRMVATDFPKFTVSLMDDTRVSFHMNEEDVRKLAGEVRNTASTFRTSQPCAAWFVSGRTAVQKAEKLRLKFGLHSTQHLPSTGWFA